MDDFTPTMSLSSGSFKMESAGMDQVTWLVSAIYPVPSSLDKLPSLP